MLRLPTLPRHAPVRHAIGVDLSDVNVQALELVRGPRNTLSLLAYSRVALPPNVIRDGVILQTAAFQAAIQEAVSAVEPAPFRTRDAIVSLPESKVFLRVFELPRSLTEAQVIQTIPFEAEGALPLTLDEVYYDVLFHRSRADTHHVLFAAAPRRVVDTYLEALRAGGVNPIAFDIEAAALARSIVGAREEPVMVADIGGRVSVISIIERETVHSATTLPIAGNVFTERIHLALQISPEEAEARKRSQGMAEGAELKQQEVLRDALTPLLEDVQRTAQYHEFHTGRPVRDLFLAGGSASLPGLVEHMTRETQMRVRIGDPWTARNIKVPQNVPGHAAPRVAVETAGALSTVVGLALRGVEKEPAVAGVNLLPPAVKQAHLLWRATLLASSLTLAAAVTVLLLATVVASAALLRWVQLRALRLETSRVHAHLTSAPVARALEEVKAVNQELDHLSQFHREVTDAALVLRSFKESIPPEVDVNELELSMLPSNDSPLLTVKGIAGTRDLLLEFERRLRHIPYVEKMEAPLSNLDAREHAPFTFVLHLRHPEPS